MPFVDRKDASIYYEITGDPASPPVLLIMGMGFSSRAWDVLPERLAERYRVITFDNRGTGRSRLLGKKPFTVRDLADDAAAVLSAAGVRSADVFGISLGGMIAQELALRHPEKVRALALGATHFGFWSSEKLKIRTLFDLFIVGVLRRRHDPRRAGRFLVSDDFLVSQETRFLEWFANRTDPCSPAMLLAQVLAVARHDTRRRVASIRARTLILTGNADLLIPSNNSRSLAEVIAGAKLVVLEGAGHVFPLEREEETIRALSEHFELSIVE
jgi:3-oxoadipate enol-lactonase